MKKAIWIKPYTKKKYTSSYQFVSLNKKRKQRVLVFNGPKRPDDVELFESHEKAKQAGWKKLNG